MVIAKRRKQEIAPRNGRSRESQHLRSTVAAGEPTQRNPVKGRGCRLKLRPVEAKPGRCTCRDLNRCPNVPTTDRGSTNCMTDRGDRPWVHVHARICGGAWVGTPLRSGPGPMIFWFWTRPAINATAVVQPLAAQLGSSLSQQNSAPFQVSAVLSEGTSRISVRSRWPSE